MTNPRIAAQELEAALEHTVMPYGCDGVSHAFGTVSLNLSPSQAIQLAELLESTKKPVSMQYEQLELPLVYA